MFDSTTLPRPFAAPILADAEDLDDRELSAAEAEDTPRPRPEDLSPYVDDLPVPPIIDLRGEGDVVHRTVTLRAATVRYSRQLAPTAAWTYEGTVPGPTFIVSPEQTVRVRWHNAIDTTLPYRVGVCDDPGDGDPIPQNSPGLPPDVSPNPSAAVLTSSTVVHLHGGRTCPDSDGWTEHVSRRGQSQRCTYGPPGSADDASFQRGTLLWYHDHGMGVTRLNVYAGLFGLWVLRDPLEDTLAASGVIPGESNELRLVIQDRNFDADDLGRLTGALLHKTEKTTAEMFGPYTLVNGALWPRREVAARPTRLRLLNGSNARTYCLRLVEVGDDGAYGADVTQEAGLIWQIGTDGGLLDHPVTLPDRGLMMAPAERVDLVVDFSKTPGRKLAFVNTAFAPFHGNTVTAPGDDAPAPLAPGQPAPDNRLPFAHILRFDVGPDEGALASPLTPAATLDPAFRRYVHDSPVDNGRAQFQIPENHFHRWIALTEDPPGNLLFRELEPVTTDAKTADATGLSLIAIESRIPEDQQTPGGPTTRTTWYRTTAVSFHDAVRMQVSYNTWEVWNILNLTGDTHPIHVHLVQFQALTRQQYATDGYVNGGGFTFPGQPLTLVDAPQPPDANEQGFKDTIRVNPNESLAITALFDGFCGRYMYHCHILEHEDHDMMRPFVVGAPDAMAVMDSSMGGMMGGMVM